MNRFYELLGASPSMSLGAIRGIYIEKIKQCHPDRNNNDIPNATLTTQRLVEAYKAICDYRKESEGGTTSTIGFNVEVDWEFNIPESLKRKKEFSEALRCFKSNPSDLITSLRLIHFAFEAEQHDVVFRLLKNKLLIDSSSLLLRLVDPDSAGSTLTGWAKYLNNEGCTFTGIQMLADALNQSATPGFKLYLTPALYRLTYDFCAGKAPCQQPIPSPEIRVILLRQLILNYHIPLGYLHKQLAVALFESGETEEAKQSLREALRIDPNLTGMARLSKALNFPMPSALVARPQAVAPIKHSYTFASVNQLPSEWDLLGYHGSGDWERMQLLVNIGNFSPKIISKARPIIARAAWFIGYSGRTEAIPYLMELSKMNYGDFRTNSRLSLARLGNEETLSFMQGLKPASVATCERNDIQQAVDFLKSSIAARSVSLPLLSTEALIQQGKAALKNKNAGKARYCFEFVLNTNSLEPLTRVEISIALASAAESVGDLFGASTAILSIYNSLSDEQKARISEKFSYWLLNSLPHVYDARFDDLYLLALDSGLLSIVSAKSFNDLMGVTLGFLRVLTRIGHGKIAEQFHGFIAREAPGNDYFHRGARSYCSTPVTLSPSLSSHVANISKSAQEILGTRIQGFMNSRRRHLKANT